VGRIYSGKNSRRGFCIMDCKGFSKLMIKMVNYDALNPCLPDGVVEDFEKHMAGCDACRKKFYIGIKIDTLMDDVPYEDPVAEVLHYINSGEFGLAEPYLLELLKKDPTNYDYLRYLHIMALYQRDFKSGLKLITYMFAICKKEGIKPYALKKGELKKSRHIGLMVMVGIFGEYVEKEFAAAKVKKKDPNQINLFEFIKEFLGSFDLVPAPAY
jgi:hypothetical protein